MGWRIMPKLHQLFGRPGPTTRLISAETDRKKQLAPVYRKTSSPTRPICRPLDAIALALNVDVIACRFDG